MSKLFFQNVALAPPDSIFGLQAAFEADGRPDKVNLSIGVYKNDQLITPVLDAVKEAEAVLVKEEITKDYLPIGGHAQFLERVGTLVFGDPFWKAEKGRICAAQSPGGTGALRIGGELIHQEVGKLVAISDPTWPNHKAVFERCRMKVVHYSYYDKKENRVDFERVLQALKNLQRKTVVVLHACCHNPTGADFSLEEWKELAVLFQEKELLPFFDFAYQGFGRGLEEDAAAIRLFAKQGLEMFVAVSQSKNFGLYSERIGALFAVTESKKTQEVVQSQLKTIIRANYSNPPRHGAAIIEHILSTPDLKLKWEEELKLMRERITALKKEFVQEMSKRKLKTDYSFLSKTLGMFCYTGLSPKEVERMQKEFAIYLTSDGRMNVAGLPHRHLMRVVDGIEHIIRFP